MIVKEFIILYFDEEKTTKTTCEVSELFNLLKEIYKKYNNNVSIYIHPKSEKIVKNEINKYYKSKYVIESKLYKQGKIDKRTFENRVNMLKKLKKRCKTKSKFEEKYKEYKKSTNNIPPYSVSE